MSAEGNAPSCHAAIAKVVAPHVKMAEMQFQLARVEATYAGVEKDSGHRLMLGSIAQDCAPQTLTWDARLRTQFWSLKSP